MDVLDLASEIVPSYLEEILPRETLRSPGRCLVATRVGMEALRYFGIASEPMFCEALGANRAWLDWTTESYPDPPVSPMPDEAWSVYVGPGSGNPDVPGIEAHAVLVVGDDLLDLDSGQFARPAKGILVPESLKIPIEIRHGRRSAGLDLDGGGTLGYAELRKPPHNWRSTPDWRLSPRDAGPVIRRIRERIEG